MSTAVLTVIGSSGTYPSAGRACSSYLLEADGGHLLLDCGNGSLANLTQASDLASLDAILLSHLHPDHFADLYGMLYALRFHAGAPEPLDVYAPVGAQAHIGQLLSGPHKLTDQFRFRDAAAGDRLAIGPFDVTLFAAAHSVETLAPRVEAGGRTLAYSGDSGPTDELVACARDADLFLCEASWLEADGPHPEGLHMTGADAGRHAERAGARRLMVTHVFPDHAPAEAAGEASRHFGGEVIVANDLEEHRL